MISQKITYTDLDEKVQTKTFMFNLGQQDFVRLQLRYPPTIQECYEKLVAENNIEGAYDLLSDLIESAYGVREGDAFVKNRRVGGRDTRPDLANFKFQPAFEQLMADLLGNRDVLLNFFRNLTTVKMTDEDFNRFAEAIKNENEETPALVEADPARFIPTDIPTISAVDTPTDVPVSTQFPFSPAPQPLYPQTTPTNT